MVRKTSLTDKYKCSTVAAFRPSLIRILRFATVHFSSSVFVVCHKIRFAPWPNVLHQKYVASVGVAGEMLAFLRILCGSFERGCMCVPFGMVAAISHERQTKRQTPILMWNTVDLMILSGADAVYTIYRAQPSNVWRFLHKHSHTTITLRAHTQTQSDRHNYWRTEHTNTHSHTQRWQWRFMYSEHFHIKEHAHSLWQRKQQQTSNSQGSTNERQQHPLKTF